MLRQRMVRRHLVVRKHILLPVVSVRLLLLRQVVLLRLAVGVVGLRTEGVFSRGAGLSAGARMHALIEVFDDGLGLHEALELLVEALVDLGEMQFALAVGHVLKVHVVAVRH